MAIDEPRDIEDILASYVDRLNEGDRLDPDRILAEHPVHGPEILDALESFVESTVESETNEALGTLGDYTLRRQIGRGGMGVVYDAWENSMDRRVALKVLPAGIAADPKASARFLREAQIAGKLSHPAIVPVYFTAVKDQTPFYAMELVEGETLAKILLKVEEIEDEAETPFGPKNGRDYFIRMSAAFVGVADGLQHAHSKGVIHRDIKPSNLILDREGRLRILDFGLARLEGQESLTISGDVVGTPLYMSPEQARRKKIQVDHRTDVYSLGATMYETICGRPPFKGKDHQDTLSQIIERNPAGLRKLNERVPRELETIVLKCLRKEAYDRYGTAEALGQDLRRFVRGDPVEARPEGRWDRLVRKILCQRRKIAGCVVLLGLLACVALLGRELLDARRYARELTDADAAEILGGFFDAPEPIDVRVEGILWGPAVAPDELTLYFSRFEDDPRGNVEIYYLTRASRDVPFVGPARELDALNSPYEEWAYGNCVTKDGDEIYFVSTRPGMGFQDVWMAQFNVPGNPDGGFHDIKNLGPAVNTAGADRRPCISSDGLRLYFESAEQGYVVTREKKGEAFGNRVPLKWRGTVSADELTLFWTEDLRGSGNHDIWVSTRACIHDAAGRQVPFDNFFRVGPPVNTALSEYAPGLTATWPASGAGLYFMRATDQWVTTLYRAAWRVTSDEQSSRRASRP